MKKRGVIYQYIKPLVQREKSALRPFSIKIHGTSYHPYTRLSERNSAATTMTNYQKIGILLMLIFIFIGLIVNWRFTFISVLTLLTIYYFFDIISNIFLLVLSTSFPPEIKIDDTDIIDVTEWPTYTILCPLYKETIVLPQFIEAMNDLDYPKEKLRIILLLEEDDKESQQWVNTHPLPSTFDVQVVPHSLPKTKPKALNYGLQLTTSDYVVIYDAEDIPEVDQLKKTVLAFKKVSARTACIQAKLCFYNGEQNILTRLFTSEYYLWFNAKLTGLQALNAPIPLGGTSNHFKTHMLRELGGWDPFNVTEDCDLGIRIAKAGYLTAIVDSITYEEANSKLGNWIRQRTRWIKGYMQTYLVHIRNPLRQIKTTSFHTLFSFQTTVGGKTFTMLFNPIMWFITFSYFAMKPFTGPFIESLFPTPVLYLAVVSLIFGNFLHLYQYMIAVVDQGDFYLVKYIFFVPFYWLAMSLAAYIALYEVIRKPFYWAKTQHGLHIPTETIDSKKDRPSWKIAPFPLYS